MSLIDPRHVCDACGGYRTGFKTTLSSACRCPDYHPIAPSRHQIGAPTAGSCRVGGVRVRDAS